MQSKRKVIIIAEAGLNHNGKIELAHKLIDKAFEFGADFIKFQSFQAEKLLLKEIDFRNSGEGNDGLQQDIFSMFKELELTYAEQRKLYEHCKSAGLGFLSTPFDMEAVQFLADLKLSYWKIASGEITNLPFLRAIAKHPRPMLLSTGMSTLADIEAALQVLTEGNFLRKDIILLHCNSAYPTPFKDANLKAIQTLQSAFGLRAGYSDHTLGIEAVIAAVAMGACVIEKHFTLDTDMAGPDHKASINPEQFAQMVGAIRNIEQALGDGRKRPSQSETATIQLARKSIVAACQIKKGEKFTTQNLITKRPGSRLAERKVAEAMFVIK